MCNNLKPRTTTIQTQVTFVQTEDRLNQTRSLFFKGITTYLKPGDPLLLVFDAGKPDEKNLFRVQEVIPNPAAGYTRVIVRAWTRSAATQLDESITRQPAPSSSVLDTLLDPLEKQPNPQLANADQLNRNI